MAGSAGLDMNDAELGHLSVPLRGYTVEDQPEVAPLSGGQRSSGNGLDIHIGLPRADEVHRLGGVLGDEIGVVPEEHLRTDAGDGAVAGIDDVAFEVGDAGADVVRGLAHGQVTELEAGRVRVERRIGRGGFRRAASVLERNDDNRGNDRDDHRSDYHREPVAIAGRLRDGLQAGIHERNLTTVT